MGWIKEAESAEEAARLAGCLDPERAAATIDAYNAACASGEDEFGRPTSSLVPIDQPPYYCVPVYPGGATTNGGPRRDAKARILNRSEERRVGKECVIRVDLGGRRIIKKKTRKAVK